MNIDNNTPILRIDKLRKKDYKLAIASAIKGMHFDWYMDQKWMQKLYGKYFLYSELLNATNIYVAYYGKEFAGLMLVNMKDKKKIYKSITKRLYVKFFNILEKIGDNEADIYDVTNDNMLTKYELETNVDGEISFLAANPSLHIKGVGRFLMSVAEKDLLGKRLYLFTDDACNFGFYEHMKFEKIDSEKIILDLPKGHIPIECYLFSKIF